MNNHLSEDQITGWVLGTMDEFVSRHIQSCGACSVQAEELRRAVFSFHDSVHAAAERDSMFWRKQQLAIRDQLSAKNWYPMPWAWAVALLVVLMAAILLTRPANFPRPTPSEDADKLLLQEVQGDLGRDVPEALAPAVLIAEERNEILTSKVSQPTETTLKKRRQMK